MIKQLYDFFYSAEYVKKLSLYLSFSTLVAKSETGVGIRVC